jgi:hypothetical protein
MIATHLTRTRCVVRAGWIVEARIAWFLGRGAALALLHAAIHFGIALGCAYGNALCARAAHRQPSEHSHVQQPLTHDGFASTGVMLTPRLGKLQPKRYLCVGVPPRQKKKHDRRVALQ